MAFRLRYIIYMHILPFKALLYIA